MPATAPSQVLPTALTSLRQWTKYKANKAPIVKVNAPDMALNYEALSSYSNIGIILVPDNDVAVIDVDYPGTKDEKLTAIAMAKDFGFKTSDWSTPRYAVWVRENFKVFQQLEGTGLEELLTTTYCEWSPSGMGLHLWVRVPDKNSKTGAYFTSTNPALHGQFSFTNCFMTVTRQPLHGCSPSLTTVLSDFAPQAFDFSRMTHNPEKGKKPRRDETDAVDQFLLLAQNGEVSQGQITEALELVSCTLTPKVQKQWKELTGRTYQHYDFWVTIGMALHDYGTQTGTLPALFVEWLNWSKKDTANFDGEETVEKKWRSFGETDSGITIATLLALASRLKFEYPRPIVTKEGKRTVMPIINEYINFQYLMRFYDIKVWEDDQYYLSGDDEIMRKYFSKCGNPYLGKYYGPYTRKDLEAFMLVLCQDSNWRKMESATTHVKTWLAMATKPYDPFLGWLNTPYSELTEDLRTVYTEDGSFPAYSFDNNSTVEYLFECLNVRYKTEQERGLYFTLFKKTLMQIIKFREPEVLKLPFVDNGGMLILTGEENTYKSTFCKLLLPRQLDKSRKEINTPLTGEKNIRDFLRYFSTKTIVQLDEFESMMDVSSSFFKNLLSGNDNSFVDIYGTQETYRERKAIIIGTTNQSHMVLSENGTRRMWIIPVGKIDTSAALRVNLHKLYNDLRAEFRMEFKKGTMPWLLSQAEIDLLNKQNTSYAARSDLDLVLEEIWPIGNTTMPKDYLAKVNVARLNSPKIMTSNQIRTLLTVHGFRGKATAIEHALKRHCLKWTGLKPGEEKTDGVRVIKNGKIYQGWVDEKQNYVYARWIMPPQEEEDHG